ncbi:S8 family peptidase [Crocosphaera sp. Alani8]|uniref:S8 family peptidase n=1 Tax=Crocosphaera sp. Alani8 TaxID=3038952 RepID=UPI00313CAFF3
MDAFIPSSSQLPRFRKEKLIVKIRSSANLNTIFSAARGSQRISSLTYPGLAILSTFDRAGLIRKVTPIAPPRAEEVSILATQDVFTALQASLERVPSDDVCSGVSIIELEDAQYLPEIQLALANDPNVEYASRIPIRYLVASTQSGGPDLGITATPPPTIWNLKKIRWADARALPDFREATDIKVAVLDTGIDVNHPDLKGKIKNYVFDAPDLANPSSNRDILGHGTHVAGTIAASINNDIGINGICDCHLGIWKVFDDTPDFVQCGENGYQYLTNDCLYLRALCDCIKQNIDVVNLSIAGTESDPFEIEVFRRLIENGTTVVAGMGNSAELGNPVMYPAAYPDVIAVGATKQDDKVTIFSSFGNHISISAPGNAIWSTLPTYPGHLTLEAVCDGDNYKVGRISRARDIQYDAWAGTSMATPHVTGAVALVLANKGRMKPSEVRMLLRKTADKVPDMEGKEFDPRYGAGRLNLLRLLSE